MHFVRCEGPGHKQPACHAISTKTGLVSMAKPLSASEPQLQNCMGTHRESLRGPQHSSQGLSDLHFQKQDICGRGSAICHIFFRFGSPLCERALDLHCVYRRWISIV